MPKKSNNLLSHLGYNERPLKNSDALIQHCTSPPAIIYCYSSPTTTDTHIRPYLQECHNFLRVYCSLPVCLPCLVHTYSTVGLCVCVCVGMYVCMCVSVCVWFSKNLTCSSVSLKHHLQTLTKQLHIYLISDRRDLLNWINNRLIQSHRIAHTHIYTHTPLPLVLISALCN